VIDADSYYRQNPLPGAVHASLMLLRRDSTYSVEFSQRSKPPTSTLPSKSRVDIRQHLQFRMVFCLDRRPTLTKFRRNILVICLTQCSCAHPAVFNTHRVVRGQAEHDGLCQVFLRAVISRDSFERGVRLDIR
jgi:hypothetical protein